MVNILWYTIQLREWLNLMDQLNSTSYCYCAHENVIERDKNAFTWNKKHTQTQSECLHCRGSADLVDAWCAIRILQIILHYSMIKNDSKIAHTHTISDWKIEIGANDMYRYTTQYTMCVDCRRIRNMDIVLHTYVNMCELNRLIHARCSSAMHVQ